ncbi:MAG: UDP-3-O-(3-hydroxymyristoyl)glucosamine N-acyltransferase [Bacteroidetes bacterium]|nr:MAG: UDP-3-O-(3-hydroxymyristoyl)glucosamine N-acyltransferase [Bacteroidota bacterium]
MKLTEALSLKDAAEFLNCDFLGDPAHLITGLNEIHMVETGDLVFVDHPKYYEKALHSAATTILIDKKVDCPPGKGLLISAQPFDDYNRLTKHYTPFKPVRSGQGENVRIHPDAIIYPNVFIGNDVEIGAGSILYPGACIMDRTIIGKDVKVGPGSIIGYDAFYYKKKADGFDQMHSSGGVILEDRVDIGAGCTIDKGVSADTTIGYGTKIDNQVHVGHDCIIGKHCLIAAQVGLAGCVRMEDHVTLWGQVGCTSDVTIEEGVTVYAQSGIKESLEAGKTYFGSPCGEAREKFRELAAIKKIPELLKK